MRQIIESITADGVVMTTYRYLEKRHVARTVSTVDGSGAVQHVAFAERTSFQQVSFEIEGGSFVLEPGAFQYGQGDLRAELLKHEPRRGIVGRMMASAATGESAYGTRFAGRGKVWTEPTRSHFIMGTMDDESDSLLLDDRTFYACTSGVSLSTHVHRSVSGVFSGNGFAQPRISGRGGFVVQSPVPIEELDTIVLENGEAIIDGDLMLMYSASLQVEIGTLVPGLLAAKRSGEGFVYRLKGSGSIWVMPTLGME